MSFKAKMISEPELMFTPGIQESIIDPKVGLMSYGPLDANTKRRSSKAIRLGLLSENDQKPIRFLNKLIERFPPRKTGDQQYGGFEQIYKIPLVLPQGICSMKIPQSDIDKIAKASSPFHEASRTFDRLIQQFHDRCRTEYDILLIEMPLRLEALRLRKEVGDLRCALKIPAIRRQIRTQIITSKALDSTYDADVMWNFSLAIYSKAGGVPWKLRRMTDTDTFIGIAYGITTGAEGRAIFSGIAEIFDEFGESVSIQSLTSKAEGEEFLREVDRTYHLSSNKMSYLLSLLLEDYRSRIDKYPKKVAIHNTTYFSQPEIDGVTDAASKSSTSFSLVYVSDSPLLRIYGDGPYPPNRGIWWQTGGSKALVYTTGYVEPYKTYPGIGTAKPLEITVQTKESEMGERVREVLALTKMDWNTTNLMIREPVTTKYARRMVELLKAGLEPHEVVKDLRYYM